MDQDFKIKKNFFSDWVSILKNEILSMGYSVDSNLSEEEVSLLYFNIQHRMITPKKRKVEISTEFSCPEEFKDGVDLIKDKIERGEELYPHQSTKIADPSYSDSLFNDWGIHHLHLGTSLRDDGFIERTGPVLFIRVADDTIYFIDVLRHGRGYQPWIKQKLLHIIHNNWPESISQFKLIGVDDVEHKPTDPEIGQLRKGRVNVILQMDDGTVYAPIGGGMMTSGLSLEVRQTSDYYSKLIQNIEEYVEEKIEGLSKLSEDNNIPFGKNPHFKLIAIEKDFCLILEVNTRYAYKIPMGK